MKLNVIVTLCLPLLLFKVSSVLADPQVDQLFSAEPIENRAILMEFLAQDCEVGETPEALDNAIQLGQSVVPILHAIQEDGPPTDTVLAIKKSIEKRWQARQQYLEQNAAQTFSASFTAKALNVSESDYALRQEKAAVKKFQERAALLLERIE